MIAPVVLAGFILSCAPQVDARTTAAIVQVESAGRPYAVNDNSAGRAYFPATLEGARALLRRLAGHQVAVGIVQLDSVNFARFRTNAVAQLDPCVNLRLGTQVLVEDYRREYPRAAGRTIEERRQVALRRAFSAYNSGSPTAARRYADLVVSATSSLFVRETTEIADAARGSGAKAHVARLPSPKPRKMVRVAYAPARASSCFAGCGR
jgi:type IV secretion system protein VirB1